ncbi:hypothetical protein [Chryseobacterium lineare]
MFIDPDGRKAAAAQAPMESLTLTGGLMQYYGSGGTGVSADVLGFLGVSNDQISSILPILGKGGGSTATDPTPKKSIWKSIGNFFRNLFGRKKSTAGGHTVKAEIIDIALIPEGVAAESSAAAESIAAWEQIAVTIGVIARAGQFAIPLMLNGDSQFAPNSKPITGTIDIPATTTDSEPEEMITLYRGVHGKHPDLANAYMGIVIPWGGSATALQHNRGDNNSMFTSWSTSIDVANFSASRRGPGGIILKQSFPLSRLSFFDRHGEGEVQVFGPVFGAQKINPWNGGTWTPYIK